MLSGFCIGVHAQQKSIFSLKAGFGINGCQIHGDNYTGYDKGGLFAGFAVNAEISAISNFELGFYFSQKGARHNSNPNKGDYSSYYLNLNYLDMPLLYRLNAGKRWFLTLGPSVGYLISYKEVIDGSNMTGQPGGNDFEKFEVSVNAGLGARLKSGLEMELRTTNSILPVHNYGVGHSNVYYPNPIAQMFNEGFYNNILTLFISYKFNAR
ncbi:MAG TPA: porin family protein [Bacteroidia bacterium]|nr:porin family protein [Bacteroidia bacterium]